VIRSLLYKIARSLSARLLGIFLVTSLIYAFTARFAVDLVLNRDYLREMIGSHVALHTTYFLRDLGLPPSIERARQIAANNPMDIRIIGPGDIDWSSDPAFPDLSNVKFEPGSYFDHVPKDIYVTPDGKDVTATMAFARHDEHSFVRVYVANYRILIASPKISVRANSSLAAPLLIGLISTLVLAGCFFAVSWLIRPIGWIKDGAERIGKGELDYRIPTSRRDDLGRLAVDINLMADDVQGMLEAKQQMLLAISHELRSPLTRTKVALEFLDDETTKRSILGDVLEMENLITDLLESERLNTRHLKLQISKVDLVQLIKELVAIEFQQEQDRIEVRLAANSVPWDIDEIRIRLLLKNLIDNALCYSHSKADQIVVQLEATADSLTIAVSDRGSGMSPDQVERATEPFYRADPARSRDTGGFGLGLYLCCRIATAHGGILQIDSEVGRGTTVSLVLPASFNGE
jgi:signal transduction histidine kinase